MWVDAVVFTGMICFLDSPTHGSILNRQYKQNCSLLGDVGEVEYAVVTALISEWYEYARVLLVGTQSAEINLLSSPCFHSTVCSVHQAPSPGCPALVKLTVAKATGN